MKAGGTEESRGGARRRLPKLKIPAKIWKNRKQQNYDEDDELDCVVEVQQEQEEQLEEISRRLIIREDELFSQDAPSEEEEEEDQLQKDFEDLRLQICMAIHNTFTPSSSCSSSSSSSTKHLEVLRSAVASIQQQEVQDRRWADCSQDRVPVWRPQKCLSTHNALLQNMVEDRLTKAAEDDSGGVDKLSSAVKRQVCRMGKCVKEDLLSVVRTVKDCYPPQMDILNVYAALYHRSFFARLTELATSELETEDCSYLLFWVNHYYPLEILKHEELDGQIKTACLGSLLLKGDLNRLEEQYLVHKEDKVKLWLNTALKKEKESWLSGRAPELIDCYYFSPLAVDVIQVTDGCLTEFNCAIKDQSKTQRLTAHLENFLCSYKKCVEEFVKGNHSNVRSVIKAQLVCEQQLRDYITRQTGSLSEEQRRRCLDTLSALRDCGYQCFTGPTQVQLKVRLSQLWTATWVDGSLPVVDSLLDSLNQQLADLIDLKPACRQSLLCALHQDVVLKYVKRMLQSRMKSREQQVAGAQRMIEDSQKIDRFFRDEGGSEASWLGVMLCRLAEILSLQDPASVQLELVSLARTFPDLSDAHVSALLSLKTGLSAADVRSIRRSVEENRLLDVSTNNNPPFFSKVKVKWISKKINQMVLKP
ncbi:tumor necrosis factor alpha-induced protein 2a isoform X1 [Stegastes partitus]|uniref:Tumor necrosis factor alpha-induced protein 2-like n=1 Tax=Stegastes partitus TaxID=144197 RepID=A0A3B4Z917_9TELE|nr:PREDICTED: tumor necrosis factor alpha-induced protein 2-like isoform X1 [Stegastes partitus]XP_008297127.1 PREDICTED: tumor necrosis factor alpha-induced protein 2-like isoform X1 [Stegastes partitus]